MTRSAQSSLLALALLLQLGTATAEDDRWIVRDGQPVTLPFGTLSWSGLDVRAGEPRHSRPSDSASITAVGVWTIGLQAPAGKELNRHGIVIALAPGVRALPGESYGDVRLTGPALARSVAVYVKVATSAGAEQPMMALAMGDRVFIELFEVKSGAHLVLESTLTLPTRSTADATAESAPLSCGGASSPCAGFVQMAAGARYVLALTTTGEVRAWGDNEYGQLGDGTQIDRTLPVVVQAVGGSGPLTGIQQVAGGEKHSVALTNGGEVRSWGGGGLLGDGTSNGSWLPVVVQAPGGGGPLTGIRQVTAGGGHSLAVTGGGEVRAWGDNAAGQLGDGTWTTDRLPVVVQSVGGGGPLTGIEQVAAGEMHSLALTSSGEVRAWGYNFRGQLGDGTLTSRLLPVVVQTMGGGGPLTGIRQVAAAGAGLGNHSLALTIGGEVRAWGDNLIGQLGDGTTDNRPLPVVVQAVGGSGALTGIQQISAGVYYSLALTTGGEIRAWGSNYYGNLGDGAFDSSLLPVVAQAVGGGGPLTGIEQVAAGLGHSVALTTGGEVRIWGDDHGATLATTLPTCVMPNPTEPLPTFVQLAAGDYHSLALTTGGEVRAWGDNFLGQLGDGTSTVRALPVIVLDPGGGGPLTGIQQVAAGGFHSLALTNGGEVRAWGDNGYGQLGDGTTTGSLLPVIVQSVGGGGPLTGIRQVSAGYWHTLSLTAGGEVRAWGSNWFSQLGDGTWADRWLPVVVQRVGGGGPMTNVRQLASGLLHSLALTDLGEVNAWGDNSAGELGVGTRNSHIFPVLVQAVGGGGPLTGIAQVTAGGWAEGDWAGHSLALTTAGEVRAWGYNYRGQLGDGTTSDRALPVVVLSSFGGGPLTGIRQVAAGGAYSLAVTTAGEVHAWGTNFYGQLGDRTKIERSLPMAVRALDDRGPLADIQEATGGQSHALALTTGGEIRGWGFNYTGQLGNGRNGREPLPLELPCPACGDTRVELLVATRLGSDLSLRWQEAPPASSYNVWYVPNKTDIDRARLGGGPTVVAVLNCSEPAPASGATCIDVGAIGRDPTTLFHYQVRASCDSLTEGP